MSAPGYPEMGMLPPDVDVKRKVPAKVPARPAFYTEAGYERLANVYASAYAQAARGKGVERHANDNSFEQQPIVQLNVLLGSQDGMRFQAMKKIIESKRLKPEHAVAELRGAMNYIAAAIIAIEDEAKRGSEA